MSYLKRRKYDLLSVKYMLEVLYALGYTEISVSDFIDLFCEKYDLIRGREEDRISAMLRVWQKNKKISIVNGNILMWNLFSQNLRLVINDR